MLKTMETWSLTVFLMIIQGRVLRTLVLLEMLCIRYLVYHSHWFFCTNLCYIQGSAVLYNLFLLVIDEAIIAATRSCLICLKSVVILTSSFWKIHGFWVAYDIIHENKLSFARSCLEMLRLFIFMFSKYLRTLLLASTIMLKHNIGLTRCTYYCFLETKGLIIKLFVVLCYLFVIYSTTQTLLQFTIVCILFKITLSKMIFSMED